MKRIVCDTNIWYLIADKSINPLNFKDFKLVSTWINVYEILFSTNVANDIKRSQNVIKAIVEYSEIIHENPYQNVLKIISPEKYKDANISTDDLNILINDFLNCNSFEDFGSIYNRGIEIFNFQKKIFKEETEKWLFKHKPTLSKSLKQKFKANFSTDQNLKRSLDWLISDLNIYLSTNSTEDDSIIIYSDEINWELFTFYVKIQIEYYFKHIKSIQLNIKENDFNDIQNTLYVTNNDLYFTEDKDMIDTISRAGLDHFLFKI